MQVSPRDKLYTLDLEASTSGRGPQVIAETDLRCTRVVKQHSVFSELHICMHIQLCAWQWAAASGAALLLLRLAATFAPSVQCSSS